MTVILIFYVNSLIFNENENKINFTSKLHFLQKKESLPVHIEVQFSSFLWSFSFQHCVL